MSTSQTLKQAYSSGYQEAAKIQMENIVQRFNGNDFPYFYWNQPIVQEIEIPAHITNGVMIPQHKEIVMIKPGEWKKNPAYPIIQQEKVYENSQVVPASRDITAMPAHGQ